MVLERGKLLSEGRQANVDRSVCRISVAASFMLGIIRTLSIRTTL